MALVDSQSGHGGQDGSRHWSLLPEAKCRVRKRRRRTGREEEKKRSPDPATGPGNREDQLPEVHLHLLYWISLFFFDLLSLNFMRLRLAKELRPENWKRARTELFEMALCGQGALCKTLTDPP